MIMELKSNQPGMQIYIRTVEEGSSIREIFVGRVESRIQQTYRGDNPVFVDHPESGGVSGFG